MKDLHGFGLRSSLPMICYRSSNMNIIEHQLQLCLNKLQQLETDNGFRFSHTKTVCMHICQKRGLHLDPQLFLDQSPIPVVEEPTFMWVISDRTPVYMWEPHCGTGVYILSKNGQYPHNSSNEAPCLPWGATHEVDDEILVVESWLIAATKYIAIDNTPLQPRIHVDGRSGLTRVISRLVMPSSRVNNHCLVNFCQEQTLFHTLMYLLVLGRWVIWVIPCILPEYINCVSLAWMSAVYPQHSCPLVGLNGGWGHGWWIFFFQNMSQKITKHFDWTCHPQMTSPWKLILPKGQTWLHQIGKGSLSVLLSKEPRTNYRLLLFRRQLLF